MHIGPDQQKRNLNLTMRILQESGGGIEKSQHKDQQMASQGLPSDMTMEFAGDGFFLSYAHTKHRFLLTIIFFCIAGCVLLQDTLNFTPFYQPLALIMAQLL